MANRTAHRSGSALPTWLVLLASAAAIGVAGGLAWRGRQSTEANPRVVATASASDAAEEPLADWCAPGFQPIAGGGCFAPSATPGAVRPLIVYLHGRYPADTPADEVDRQRRLAIHATPRGFSVLALRGRLGTCTAAELASWYCWPSNEHNAGAAEDFVRSWDLALSTAHDRAGTRAAVLFGFSNGGYFAGLIASRALLDVDAVVVAHGGPVEPVRARLRAPPLLLLSADDDVAQDDMIRFDEELQREQWPHDCYARFGGHALADEDIDAALGFFLRAREPLPLSPPLPLHRPLRHDRDGGVGAESEEQTGESGAADEADLAYPVAPVVPATSSGRAAPTEPPSSPSPYEVQDTDAEP